MGQFRQYFSAALTFIEITLSVGFVATPAFAVTDPVIIYGGVGNLGRNVQPCLAAFYESADGKFRTYTDKINQTVWSALEGKSLLPGASDVIVQSDDLYDAMRADGFDVSARASQGQIQDFLEDNEDRTLALAIIGNFEGYAQNIWQTSKGNIYEEHFTVGVTAVLVHVAGDNVGQIVLTGSALTEVVNEENDQFSTGESDLCKDMNSMSSKVLGKITTAYSNAARRAIENLSRVRISADGAVDSIIVVGVDVQSKPVRNLFNISGASEVKDSICNRPVPCAEGDAICEGLISFMAFKVTDAFSSRGYMAIPPLGWRSWGRTAQYQVTRNVNLTGGRQDVLQNISVNVGPDSADKKLVPSITKFADITKAAPGKPWMEEHYMGFLDVEWQETGYGDCGAVEDTGHYSPMRGSYGSLKYKSILLGGQSDGETTAPNIQRFRYFAALLETLGGLEKSLEMPE
jgi:hypothetical protein